MGKKKAIKLATATAIAASAFVAVAPTQSEAATNSVDKAITKATKQMAKAYDTYHKAAKNDGVLPATGTIRNQAALAKDYYDKAKAEIAKNGGSKAKKAAYTKQLDSKKYYLERAQNYVNAVNTNLKPSKSSFTKAVDAGKAKQVLVAQTVLNKDIARFEGKVAKIYGPDARNLLLKKYADPASKLADSVNDEMKVYKAYKEIENGFLIEKNIVKAIALRDSVKDEVKKLEAKNTKLAKNLLAAVKKNNDAIDVANSPAVSKVTAVNATTVEVTYKEKVKDVEAKDYKIEGLTVVNAAVKQTDDKTVVLTTSTQEGGKEYTVKSGEEKLGLFKGISAVVPTSIKLVTTSVQSQVGKEVTLKADIGSKNAGVPVTFNVDAPTDSLNKDQVVEAYTNAEGIATYSYTQYSAGKDTVAVYPTGAPTVRAFATVYWGVDNILTVTSADAKPNTLNNNESKVYKVTYKNPTTGKPEAGKVLNLTFAENIGVTIDKITKATINGSNPYQLANGQQGDTVEVVTNANGEATFTVTGSNTTATPVVFVDATPVTGNNALDASELSVSADKLTFSAVQSTFDIQVKRDGGEEAATGIANGREYNIVVKNKDGKVAAGETVNVAFNEDLDKNISTNTEAYFIDENGNKNNPETQFKVKLDAKGEGTFVIGSDNRLDYATPVTWIDTNSSTSNKNGILEDGEPTKTAERTYFADAKQVGSELKAYNGDKAVSTFTGLETASFKYLPLNQSGKVFNSGNINAEFQVYNSGTEDVKILGLGTNGTDIVVSPGRYATVKPAASSQPTIQVKSVDNKTTSVEVKAYGITTNNTNLGSQEAKASFASTTSVADQYVGFVETINKTDKKVKFVGKAEISYSGATFKENNTPITLAEFERIASSYKDVRVSYVKEADGKVSFTVLSFGEAKDLTPPNVTGVKDGVEYGAEGVTPEFTEVGATAKLNGTTYTSGNKLTAEGNYVLVVTDVAGNSTTVKFTIDTTPVVAPAVTGNYKSSESTQIEANETLIFTFDDEIHSTDIAALKAEFASVFTAESAEGAKDGFTVATKTVSGKTVVTVTADASYLATNIATFNSNGTITLTAANLTDNAGNIPSANIVASFK